MTSIRYRLPRFGELLEEIKANPGLFTKRKIEAAAAFEDLLSRRLGTPWSYTAKNAVDPYWLGSWNFDHVFWYRSVNERFKGTWSNRIAVAHPYINDLNTSLMGQPQLVERSSSAPAHEPSVVEINIGPDLSWWYPGRTTTVVFGSEFNLTNLLSTDVDH